MMYGETLILATRKQGIELGTDEIPFNIFMKYTNDILTLCFLEEETEEYIMVAETNEYGAEEIRIIPKNNIEYISVFYDFEKIIEDADDVMVV